MVDNVNDIVLSIVIMRRNSYYCLLIFISQLLCGCHKYESYLDMFSVTEKKQLQLLEDFPIDSLDKPEIILSTNSHLVFLEPLNEHQLKLYNKSTKEFSHFLKRGQGPDEAVNIQTIGYKDDTNEIYATDLPTQSLFFISDDTKAGSLMRRYKTPFKQRFCDVVFDGDLSFFLQSAGEERFLFSSADTTFAFGEDIYIPGIKPEVVQKSLQGPCAISPDRKLFAGFSAYGDVMQIYDYSRPDDIRCVCSHVCSLPIITAEDGEMNLKTKLGVTSVAADAEYIYVLYNENILLDALKNRDRLFFSDKVLVFTWDGEARAVLQLDRPVKSITYDKSQNRVLCLGLNDDFSYGVFYFIGVR